MTNDTTAALVVMPRCRSSARVGLGGAHIDAADVVDDPRGTEQPLGERRLTGVYVGQNSQIQRSHRAPRCSLDKGKRNTPINSTNSVRARKSHCVELPDLALDVPFVRVDLKESPRHLNRLFP